MEKPETTSEINNFNGSKMYGLWLIKWLPESEFDNPWQNISDSDNMENLPPVKSLISTNNAGIENWDDDE